MTTQRIEYQKNGRATVSLRRRSSGWHEWHLLTALGERIGQSGMEKSKERARKIAGMAARIYNEGLLKK